MLRFLKSMLEMAGIVFLRFTILPRIWCVWLAAVNAAGLLFIAHIEAQVLLAVTIVAVATMALIYQRAGFTRIMGTPHYLWLPMFGWMATRIETISADPALAAWLALLLATNTVSLIIDTTDAIRYLRGERAPYYTW